MNDAIVPTIWIAPMMMADVPGLSVEPDSLKIDTAYVRMAKTPQNWFRNMRKIPIRMPFLAAGEAEGVGRVSTKIFEMYGQILLKS